MHMHMHMHTRMHMRTACAACTDGPLRYTHLRPLLALSGRENDPTPERRTQKPAASRQPREREPRAQPNAKYTAHSARWCIGSLDEPINEPRPRFLGYMPPGSGRCAIAISWIFYIFTPTTNCQLPRTTNCHNAHAQQAPQRARSRSKWRLGGGAPPPTHTEPPMARIPGRGRLSTMGASSPLEYCSLKQEIAKKALFEKENLDASHGIHDIVSICGLITREAADINQILP